MRRAVWVDRFQWGDWTVSTHLVDGFLISTVWCRGRKGTYYPVREPYADYQIGPGGWDNVRYSMGLISSALGQAAARAAGAVAQDQKLEKACPVLHAFMTLLEEDGKARTPSSLTIFTEEGSWKGVLTEKDANLKLWRTAESLEKLLQAFDKALASGNADWRRGFDPGSRQGPRKSKK